MRFFNPLADLHVTHHHLPHWDQGAVVYFVTWRLGDSLPAEKLREWQVEKELWLKRFPKPWDAIIEAEYYELFSARIDAWLDAGAGSCVLRHPDAARCVADTLRFFDGQRYALESFVVMPNHVHVLFQLYAGQVLEKTLRSWKSFSARSVNVLLEKDGSLWQHESWDRIIRSDKHFVYCQDYIRSNPEKARLRSGEYLLWERREREAPASRD